MSQKTYVLALEVFKASESALGHRLVSETFKLGQGDQSHSGPKYMPSETGHEIAQGRRLRTGKRVP